MATGGHRGGLGEGLQRGFALDDGVAFRRLMLDIYGHRCAITGRFHADDGAGDDLDVFLLQPLSHGGMLKPSNAIVVETAAARLLERGFVHISDDFLAYMPHPERAELESLSEDLQGRPLTLPDNPSLWPERAMLSYHRSLSRKQ